MPLATSNLQPDCPTGLDEDQFNTANRPRLYSATDSRARRSRSSRSANYRRLSSIFQNLGDRIERRLSKHRPRSNGVGRAENDLKHCHELSTRSRDGAPSVSATAIAAGGRNVNHSCPGCTSIHQSQSSSCCCESGDRLTETLSGADTENIFQQDPVHLKCRPGWSEENGTWIFGGVLDPRSKVIQGWNRFFLLICVAGTALDALFLYLLSVRIDLACMYVDKDFAVTITIMRALVDSLYLCHMWLQLKLAFVSKESLVLGTGQLVWDAKKVAKKYLQDSGGFIYDLFVILPMPQFIFWVVVPSLVIGGAKASTLLGVILFLFYFQYIPKVLHMVLLIRRMQHVTGYIFGTAWWGFALNLIAYFIAAHIAGTLWYLLTAIEVEDCTEAHCKSIGNCTASFFGCPVVISYGTAPFSVEPDRLAFASDPYLRDHCLRNGGHFNFGIYRYAVPLITQSHWTGKVLYPLFWGLMSLSSFGNALQPSDEPLEVIFSIIVITAGLLLFMLLIGNIQVFLHSITARKEMMQLRIRDIEWWMKRRQLPAHLRQRVRGYERQRWAATRGVDESSMVCDLPESLRREIKRHLCLDLVLQVPLFEKMDELVLDNICERLTAHLFIKGETVLREGDPVLRMLFLIRGHFRSSYKLNNDRFSSCQLGPGNFCGDELLSWCLQHGPMDRLPPSTTTLVSLDSAEVFALEARDMKFVVQHFRHKFEDEKIKWTLRFYSTSWRMWSAVTIQLAWRRFKAKKMPAGSASPPTVGYAFPVPQAYLKLADFQGAMRNRRLQMYTAMFSSAKPCDHLE